MYTMKRESVPMSAFIAGTNFDENVGAYLILVNLVEALRLNGEYNSANKVEEFVGWIKGGQKPSWFREDEFLNVENAIIVRED